MKKIKFLNGIGAMLALAAVTFTSCEKEEFNVDFEPVNAKAIISPIVLLVDDGVTTDVTKSATIQGTTEFNGNPTLTGSTVELTVSYEELGTKISVVVPDLAAGQVATLTPTVLLSREYEIQMSVNGSDAEAPKSIELKNLSDYWYEANVKYEVKNGLDMTTKEITFVTEDILEKKQIQEYLDAALANEEEFTGKTDKVQQVPVYAHSMTKVQVTYTTTTYTYTIAKKKVTPATRAEEAKVLATLTIDGYTTTELNCPEEWQNLQIEGHNHAPAGHGFGHGHGHGGYDNAGGGIIVAD